MVVGGGGGDRLAKIDRFAGGQDHGLDGRPLGSGGLTEVSRSRLRRLDAVEPDALVRRAVEADAVRAAPPVVTKMRLSRRGGERSRGLRRRR